MKLTSKTNNPPITTFPIFLLPYGEIMRTAMIIENKISYIGKTIFPSNERYCISDKGLAVCIVSDMKIIIYGYINEDGGMDNLTVLPLTEMINPKSICVINDTIILGGENLRFANLDIPSHELIVTYSISQKTFKKVPMPFEIYCKCIDDFMIDNNTLIAVDNIVYPKFLIEYDCTNPESLELITTHELPQNGANESISKGVHNQSYVALKSHTSGRGCSSRIISIYQKGHYNNRIQFYEFFEFPFTKQKSKPIRKNHTWSDILLLPNSQFLLISSMEDGVGIYYINDSAIDGSNGKGVIDRDYSNREFNNYTDTDSIQYINIWGKSVKKIFLAPNTTDQLVMIFEDRIEKHTSYSFELVSIKSLLKHYKHTPPDISCK